MYCGTTATDDVTKCISCGSSELKNICINCGEDFRGNTCPKCGVAVGEKPSTCPACGGTTYLKVCQHCGVNILKWRQDIPNHSNVNIANEWVNQQTYHKPKKKTGLVVFILIAVVIGSIIIGVNIPSSDNTSSKSVNNTVAQKELSDMEIITLPGHPKFYGDYNQAKSLWKKYKKVKVIYPYQIMNNRDALLMISGDKETAAITDITINLPESNKMTMDDVLKVVCEYIPYDIIEKYYTFKKAFKEGPTDGDYDEFHYVMTRNEKGEEANKTDKVHYQDTFAFEIIRKNNGSWRATINSFVYEGYADKWQQGSYNVEDWKVDLNKYKK